MSEDKTPEQDDVAHDDVLSLVLHIRANLDKDIIAHHEMVSGQLVLRVQADHLVKLMQFLRDDKLCYFKQLIDIAGVDYPERFNDGGRFDVVYQLLSLKYNRRLRLKVQTDEATPVPSVTGIYSTANWFEREVFDMFGVMFAGHPDHRRILTDYGFDGHPLRKDFPLTGHVEVRWDEGQKKVVYEPVSLPQDYRTLDALSPWEGMTDVQLPGDEKAVKPKYGAGEK